jgi:FtsZ-interacting cell division protein ZipA
MPTWLIVVIVVVAVAVLGAVIWLVTQEMQRKRLQQRFGPEYDRTVEESDNPRAAQRELAERERRHKELDIRPLSASARERYAREWAQVQEKFVDEPTTAVAEADRILVALMGERGYPTEGYEQQLSDLSVRHAKTLEHYRAAHTTRQKSDGASTEDLRDAMVRYRTVFEDLLTDGADDDRHDHHDRRNGHEVHETRETGQHERQASAQPRTEWNGGR